MDQKSALLAGAKRCLVEKGYAQTTARDIAETSGAHLGSIGYHYGGKDRLMNMAALELSDEWGDTINRALAEAQGQTERERVLAALVGVVDSLPASREVQSASLQAIVQAQFDDRLLEQIAAGTAGGRRAVAALLAGEGEQTDVELTQAQEALGTLTYALTVGLTVQSLIAPETLPTSKQITEALDLLTEQ